MTDQRRYVLELQGHPRFDGQHVNVLAEEIPDEFHVQLGDDLLRFERAVGTVEAHEGYEGGADAVFLFDGAPA